ncbi:hypothetical protein [Marispirochaeta sp.]|jgi:hypothetical protein|uniref:hypothetical protein n=1 Tax=Marispirochaeta sp. TaxID=2038653 RepID=UPI0029C8F1D2|nr:hypothetical protein [Marispirochaeta sp.]
MQERVGKFLRILKVELEDLEEDINTLAGLTDKRRQDRAITEYVHMENISLLKQEFAGIKKIVDELDNVELVEQETFTDFIARLKQRTQEIIHNSAYPDAVYLFVERKIDKVADYISSRVV